MNILNFKMWFAEDDSTNSKGDPAMSDPALRAASVSANAAMKQAIAKKTNPLKAVQTAVANSNVPTNKLGKVMPTDPNQTE